ncbi:biotin synthase BioB [Shimazuella kribbensis]|uniref:biotin synthase BioB n=1 Tax=Shimazuella kribbensis TaxID=139808 RepID=UPI0004230FF9|nr:biotin synthase BioB [Shimazuella kribbensis]
MNSKTVENINWNSFAEKALAGERITKNEALLLLESDDRELLAILHAAYRVRHHYYGNKVKLNMIQNVKSGYCPEDCKYCSQSIQSTASIEKYTMMDRDAIVEGAQEALRRKAGTYCIVASGRGPTNRELEEVIAAVSEIKQNYSLKICTCLGILSTEQAQRLQQAGVDRYNHNLNTHQKHYQEIVTTHTYEDRLQTIENVTKSGISPCSGCIIGMGESKEQVIDIAYELRELDADSIPINFLINIAGTPLEYLEELNPRYCLKVLALFRFICPSKEIRVSGGRETNIGHLQCLSLYPANALFVGDYLTTKGMTTNSDHQMIQDLGFEIELTCI